MNNSIIVITEESTQEQNSTQSGEKGLWGDAKSIVHQHLKEVRLPTDVLEQNMLAFLQLINKIFNTKDDAIIDKTGLTLDEVELLVEISTEGEIRLIAGGKASGKGAITLKLKRAISN